MAATTFTHLPGKKPGAGIGGWLVRALERITEAQAMRARGLIQHQLRAYDDETLQEFGYSTEQIVKLRAGKTVDLPTQSKRI